MQRAGSTCGRIGAGTARRVEGRAELETRYGERKAIVEAEDWEGPAYQSCRDAAYVAASFELSRRRDNLTFKHHREVAALPPNEADAPS